MDLNHLPKPGINFRAAAGVSSFKKKLSGITKHGDLANLKDNQEAIVDTVKKYERAIRVEGGLSRLRRRTALASLKSSDKTLTKGDISDAKKIFELYGKGIKTDKQGDGITFKGMKLFKTKDSKVFLTADGEKMIKTSDGKGFLTEEQIKRNLNLNMERDVSGIKNRQYSETQYAGGKVGFTSIGSMTNNSTAKGTVAGGVIAQANKATGLAQDYERNKSAGFISGYKENKPTAGPPPNTSPQGEKPIGL